MKRKVIQLAEKTLVISLPHIWVKEWGIQKGDELYTIPEGSKIIFTTENKRENKKITINTQKTSERVIRWWLSSLHKKGYDEIEIFHTIDQRIIFNDLVKNLFTGFTITEQTDKRCVISAISKEDEQSFENVLRRAFMITLTMGDSLAEHLKECKIKETEELLQMEKTNNQLTNFCQRLINKKGMSEATKNSFYYVINWNLEKIADDYKYLIQNLLKGINFSSEDIKLLEEVNKSFRGYYEFFYDKKQEKLVKLNDKKKELIEKLNKELKEGKNSVIISRLLAIVEKTSDFSASMIGIHTDEYLNQVLN